MDDHAEVRDFLRTRRDRITPEQAGVVGLGSLAAETPAAAGDPAST